MFKLDILFIDSLFLFLKLFENLQIRPIDIEKLKWLCPSLRYFCYINALNLIFYSSKKKETINSLYNTMVEYAFGSGKKDNLKKYNQKNGMNPWAEPFERNFI